MISKSQFIDRVKQISSPIPSKTNKASYKNFKLISNILHFERVNTNQSWDLDIDTLYDIYQKNDFINTTTIKNITGRQVNSPSVAVLMAIGCLDSAGNRV
jgi:hypothetical protein